MAIKKIIDNPFVLGYNIPDEYFCDRLKETEKIIELLQNKNNVVLVSERRIGKSSLLTHVLKDKNFTRNFSAFYVDIYKTENAEQFAKALTDAMIKGGIKFPKTISRSLLEFLSKFSFEYGLDIFDKPSIGMHFNSHGNEKTDYNHTVEELLQLLDHTVKNAIVVIDEFQQIKTYPQKRFDALLRTYVQSTENIKFVFSGSERRLLSHMFRTSTEPFYRSATDMELGRIPKETFLNHVSAMFEKFDKRIETESVSKLYDLFSGYTSYMTQVLNKAFFLTPKGRLCDQETMLQALSENLVGAENGYYDTFFRMSTTNRCFLKGLSVMRGVLHITAKTFLDMFGLTASQAQECAKVLQGTDLSNRFVRRDPRTGIYYVDDKFFEVWIRVKENISLRTQLNDAYKYVMRDPRENMKRNFPATYALTPEQNRELSQYGFLSHPVEFTDTDLSVTRYVVQKDTNGDTISLPVEDCLRLLGGTDSVLVKKKPYPLTEEQKTILSEGRTLELEGELFRFDLKNCTIKRKYVRKKQNDKTPTIS